MMLGLVLAGEAIFALPFHVSRFFRPTLLEVFQLSNTELGVAQATYGLVAMVAYFLGGPIADRFAARKLLASSLWLTASGGLYMASFPDAEGSNLLWGFYGFSTILLFWAALIRATREWGGEGAQGRAFGLLDGGRGALAAGLASIGVLVFEFSFPEGYAHAGIAQKREALRTVIYGYTAATVVAGFAVWFLVGEGRGAARVSARPELATLLRVLKLRAVWLQALIVLCAYVGFKGFDNYSLYAVQAWNFDEVEAAKIVTLGSWLRPVGAIGAGLVGDRKGVARMTVLAFALLLASDLVFAFTTPAAGVVWLLFGNVLVACLAIFGLRGLYFALFEEVGVPLVLTGTAVGLVSLVGFTPDVFVSLLSGILLDATPGLGGHQQVFMMLSGFALLGVIAALLVERDRRVAARA